MAKGNAPYPFYRSEWEKSFRQQKIARKASQVEQNEALPSSE